MTRSIGDGRVPGAPDSIYYLPDFISAEEEQALISKVPFILTPCECVSPHFFTFTRTTTNRSSLLGLDCTKAQMGLPQEKKVIEICQKKSAQSDHTLVFALWSKVHFIPHAPILAPAFNCY
jgi:hypothetical protein